MVAGRGALTSLRGTRSQPPLLLLDEAEVPPGLEEDSQLEDDDDEEEELDEEDSPSVGTVVYKPPTARFMTRKCS
jgi:hypothetical protein